MINETIDLGDNWIAVKVLSQIQWGGDENVTLQIKHRCCEIDKYGVVSGRVHPMQKNTHKKYGVRWRCHNCKTYAPKKVLLFLKLHKLHERVS